jgi:hypothetical protein
MNVKIVSGQQDDEPSVHFSNAGFVEHEALDRQIQTSKYVGEERGRGAFGYLS